jgi:K+-sensing histidine kinase KdpD
LAQAVRDSDPKKLQPLSVPKIVEQLERALMDIKYNQSDRKDDEQVFNQTENIPIKSAEQLPGQFIGKELMLFEMVGILNGKIFELEKKYENLHNSLKDEKSNTQSLPESTFEDQIEEDYNNENFPELEIKINDLISNVVNAEKSNKAKVPILLGLDHDVVIKADKFLLSKVLQSILRNAIKSTENGHIKVESFVAHEQNMFIIRIFDTGKGIPEEILPNLFEKRVSQKTDIEKSDKTDFDLIQCKKIIRHHGGTISGKNNENTGATFTVTLPINKK